MCFSPHVHVHVHVLAFCHLLSAPADAPYFFLTPLGPPRSLANNSLGGYFNKMGRFEADSSGIKKLSEALKSNSALQTLKYAILRSLPDCQHPLTVWVSPAVSANLTHANTVLPQAAIQQVERFRQAATRSSRGRPHQALALTKLGVARQAVLERACS